MTLTSRVTAKAMSDAWHCPAFFALGAAGDAVPVLRYGDPSPGHRIHSDTALYIASLVTLYTKYTGRRQNDLNAHAQATRAAGSAARSA